MFNPFGSNNPPRGDAPYPPRAPPQQRGGYDGGYGQDPRMGGMSGRYDLEYIPLLRGWVYRCD